MGTNQPADHSRGKNHEGDGRILAEALSRTRSKQRGPPPRLFLHPSPGTSRVSLPSILASGSGVLSNNNGERERSGRGNDGNATLHPSPVAPVSIDRGKRALQTAGRKRSTDRTDALWSEMQATLDEVELSASGGTHVFGPGHDGKLAELRKAQIALAQACAKHKVEESRVPTGDNLSTGDEPREPDILLVRERRREANNEYFQSVNDGVAAVVAKLEDVAVAMREVEQESKEVWSEDTA